MLELSERDRAVLEGNEGDAAALAMRIVAEMAGVVGAGRLIDVSSAHVDGCLYHGQAGLDFAERLVSGGARVSVPTTLNVGALDLLHPSLTARALDPLHPSLTARAGSSQDARHQMDLYVAMGCRPTWTCAPYQLRERPALGEHVAWAESNAIVFCNSVLGARTDRYGDFIDIAAAITGRVPSAGLHRDDRRLAGLVLRLEHVPERLLRSDAMYPVLGHLLGREAGATVAAIVGIPANVPEERLKALGAAAASSGSVAMFHAVGRTPEAPTLEAATGGRDVPEISVTVGALRSAGDELTTRAGDGLGAVSVGTPHASLAELERLAVLVGDAKPRVPIYVNTGRETLADATAAGTIAALEAAGVVVVTDTCTYLTPIIHDLDGPVMTDSAKWAWYAPANIGVDVVFGGLEECVRSAAAGRVVRDETLWAGDD